MIELRKAAGLGRVVNGGVRSRCHFSLGDYYDPTRFHWGRLRAVNEDTFRAGFGVPWHQHRDIEVITYVASGAILYEDANGNRGRIEAGQVRAMSAGTGLHHAEYNVGEGQARVFELWLLPDHLGGIPRWSTRPFPRQDESGSMVVLASGMEEDREALPIRSRSRVLGAVLRAGDEVNHALGSGQHAYLVVASGRVRAGTVEAAAGDGVAMRDLAGIEITALEDSEILLVESA